MATKKKKPAKKKKAAKPRSSKSKNRSRDRKLVAKDELPYIAKKKKLKVKTVRALRKSMTTGKRSRKKVEKRIDDFKDNTDYGFEG